MSAVIPFEIDLGILSAAERLMLPFDRYRERELDWLSFALGLAQGTRLRMARLARGSPDYFAEDAARQMALTSAMQHFNNLERRYGRHHLALPADIAAAMKREGL